MKNKRYRYYYFWIGFWLVIFGKLFLADFKASGSAMISQNWSESQYKISYIFPLGRTTLTPSGQIINSEPVYFTVYPVSPLITRAKINIEAENIEAWQIGYQTSEGFNYKISSSAKMLNWFNLKEPYIINNSLRFIIVPDLAYSDSVLKINELAVELEADEAPTLEKYLDWWKMNIKQFFNRVYGYIS